MDPGRVLVTGATGFVGGNLVRVLREEGVQVRALARRESNTLTLRELGLEVAWGDLGDPQAVREAVRGCRGVFHVAALNTFWSRDPKAFYRVNVEGTRNVLTAAFEEGVERVVYTGTWAIIGRPHRGGLATEATEPQRRDLTGLYRRTKYLAEQEALAFVDRGLDVVVVSPTVPVGPGDVKPSPSGRIVLDFMRGRFPAYVEAHLNLVDVEDVARGHLLAWQRGRKGERYILGHRNMRLKEVLEILASITGRKAPRWRLPIWVPMVGAYLDNVVEGVILRREPRIPLEGVMHAQGYRAVDCSKAVQELGFPQSSVEEALVKAVHWFREHEDLG